MAGGTALLQEGEPLCWQRTIVKSFGLDIHHVKLHTGPLNGCSYEEGALLLLFSLSSSILWPRRIWERTRKKHFIIYCNIKGSLQCLQAKKIWLYVYVHEIILIDDNNMLWKLHKGNGKYSCCSVRKIISQGLKLSSPGQDEEMVQWSGDYWVLASI